MQALEGGHCFVWSLFCLYNYNELGIHIYQLIVMCFKHLSWSCPLICYVFMVCVCMSCYMMFWVFTIYLWWFPTVFVLNTLLTSQINNWCLVGVVARKSCGFDPSSQTGFVGFVSMGKTKHNKANNTDVNVQEVSLIFCFYWMCFNWF